MHLKRLARIEHEFAADIMLGVNVCVTDTDVTLNTYNFYTAKTVSSETVQIVK